MGRPVLFFWVERTFSYDRVPALSVFLVGALYCEVPGTWLHLCHGCYPRALVGRPSRMVSEIERTLLSPTTINGFEAVFVL